MVPSNSPRCRRSLVTYYLFLAISCLRITTTLAFSPPVRPSFSSPATYTTPNNNHHQRDNHPVVFRSPFDSVEGDAEERYVREIEHEKYGLEYRTDDPTRMQLPLSPRQQPRALPVTTTSRKKAKLSYTDAGTLCITFPAAGWKSSSTLFGGAFSLAWFSAIVPATVAASGGTALFLLPFWAAGGMVAKTSLVDPLITTSVTIGQFAWSVESSLGGRRVGERSGATEDIDAEASVELALTQNGEPAQYYLQLWEECSVGVGLAQKELQRLADAINNHLAAMQKRAQ